MGTTVSFLLFIELKGTEIGIVIMFKVLCLLVLLGLTQANEMKLVKKWAKKIAQHHFMTSCVGEKTMMKMWEKVEKTANECLQLEPAFDIPLFEGDDGDDMDDLDVNPFITSNQGFQTLPSQVNPVATRFGAQQPQQFAAYPWNWMYNPYQQFQNRGYAAPYRYKRAVKTPTAEEFEEFKGKVAKAKEMKKDMIGNKTCVLSKCGALDKNLNINLQHFTVDMWNMMDPSEYPEPEFKEMMIKGFNMCYKYSQSIPQDILAAKGPMYEMFGRQMKFFMCKKMMMKDCCVKKELKKWTEYLYGDMEPAKLKELGLPTDPYQAALYKWEIMDKMEEPSKKYVFESIFGM